MKTVEPRLRYTRGKEERRFWFQASRKAEIVGREALEDLGILIRNKLETYYFVYREYYYVPRYVPPFYNVVWQEKKREPHPWIQASSVRTYRDKGLSLPLHSSPNVATLGVRI